MAYYPQFPPAAMPIYAYPMPAFSNQEFFAMYPQSQGVSWFHEKKNVWFSFDVKKFNFKLFYNIFFL